MDSSLAVSDIIEFVGADVDFHDLELRANGTPLLMGSEIITMNVADSVPDPNDLARAVIDCILQELDENGNIIWAWRATDHIPPTFCSHCNWEASLIDAYHHNAFETLDNGDILLCMRNMVLRSASRRARSSGRWVAREHHLHRRDRRFRPAARCPVAARQPHDRLLTMRPAASRWRRGVWNTSLITTTGRPRLWRRGPTRTATSPALRAASSALRMVAP